MCTKADWFCVLIRFNTKAVCLSDLVWPGISEFVVYFMISCLGLACNRTIASRSDTNCVLNIEKGVTLSLPSRNCGQVERYGVSNLLSNTAYDMILGYLAYRAPEVGWCRYKLSWYLYDSDTVKGIFVAASFEPCRSETSERRRCIGRAQSSSYTCGIL